MTELTQGHATNSQDLLWTPPFYSGFKIPVLEQVIGWGPSTAQLTSQLNVCIRDRMGLAGVPFDFKSNLSLLIQQLLYFFSITN